MPIEERPKEDRISALPEFIIHQILSYFSKKEAAQKTALSKAWLQAWSTSPILILDEEDYFYNSHEFQTEENRYQFFNFVDNTLLRYRIQNLRINKFEVSVLRVDDQAIVCRLLDQSIKTALDHGVKELHISVSSSVEVSPYTLPPTIFTSTSALTDLSVCQCKFPQNFAINNFPFLKTLDLHLAYIDDGMLEKLFSSCPSIEKVSFFQVLGFKRFLVSNLGELKVLNISSGNEGIELDIQAAPSLRVLLYWGKCYRMPCLLKVGSAQNLKYLTLARVSITHNFLKQLISINFPFLEYLKMVTCYGLEMVDISSRSLKHLLLVHCKKLVKAKIDAPNLLTLEYQGKNVLSLSLHNTPEELMPFIFIFESGLARPNNTWFHQLKELLKSVSRANVFFSIPHHGLRFGTNLDFRANPLPLVNAMPEMDQSSSVFAGFLETFFSCFRPTTISKEKYIDRPSIDFIKFLGNELIMATRNSYCCSCDLEETKCWRHYLKDIKVEVYEDSQNAWQPLQWETLLVESIFLYKEIRFSLKWNANLNAQD